MPFSIAKGKPTKLPVAGCAELADLAKAAALDYRDMVTADEAQIEAGIQHLSNVLAPSFSPRAHIAEALELALDSSGVDRLEQARGAVASAMELFDALAVKRRSPVLIAAATGVELNLGYVHCAVQVVSADDFAVQQDAVVILDAGRWSSVQPVTDGAGSRLAKLRFRAARAITDLIDALADPDADQAPFIRALQSALSATEALQAPRAGIPGTVPVMRQYVLNQLDAEIFIYELLQTEFAANGCRIESPSARTMT